MGTAAFPKVHWIVRLNYRNRSITFGLLFAVLWLHLTTHDGHDPGPLFWLLLAFQLLIYPHLLYLLGLRSSHMLRTETSSMLLDSALFGCWVAVMGFPLWISCTMLLSVQINMTIFHGLKGLFKCVLAIFCGVIVGVLVFGFRLEPDSSLVATLAIILLFSLYLLMVSHSAYLRNLSLRAAREKLRQNERELQQKLVEIHGLQIQLSELVNRDSLTGLHNRRYFDAELANALADRRPEHSLCLLMIDIDHFKQINDNFGHQAGDHVLARLAGVLTSHCRVRDVICRYGGEEFSILMPAISLANARRRGERIRRAFADMQVSFNGQALQVSLSIGIAACPLHADTAEQLVGYADQALYQAKATGRNQVAIWKSENYNDNINSDT